MNGERQVGVVVIGRNEGDRLKRCLRSLRDDCPVMVYVDSGSTDGSAEFARSLGVDVVDLDLSKPFTMARGRNAGFQRVHDVHSAIEYVQFVDGDCEVVPGWIPAAMASLDSDHELVAVCGRLREKFPEASRFNQLCDLEWEQPPGYSRSCGGIAMFRAGPFLDAGGFKETMIAGEEGELCFRLRSQGWKILRLNQEMALHDAAMTRLSQWIQRAIRGGHACAEGAFLHGNSTERYNVRQMRSALFWGGIVPAAGIASLMLSVFLSPWMLILTVLLAGGYLLLGLRIYQHNRNRSRHPKVSLIHGCFCLFAKTPEAVGVLRFWLSRLLGNRSKLIEYK